MTSSSGWRARWPSEPSWPSGPTWSFRRATSCRRGRTSGLRLELDALTPAVFESSLPAQALHGDVSMGNLLRTDSGPVWNDLEDVCAGPRAWDVAGLVASARARGHSAKYVGELLDAYGDPGAESLEPFLEAHALYDTVWQAYRAGLTRGPAR